MNKKIVQLTCFPQFHNFGKIKLHTGCFSPIYPELNLLASDPKKLKIIISEMANILNKWKFDIIVSPAVRGILYGLPVALKINKPFVFIRKKKKKVHLGKILEGGYRKGQRAVIIDDGITWGKTKKFNIEILEQTGIKLVGMIVLFDAWGGKMKSEELINKRKWLYSGKFKFKTLVTFQDTLKFYYQKGLISEDFFEIIYEFLINPFDWSRKRNNWKKFKRLAKKEKNITLHKSFKDI